MHSFLQFRGEKAQSIADLKLEDSGAECCGFSSKDVSPIPPRTLYLVPIHFLDSIFISSLLIAPMGTTFLHNLFDIPFKYSDLPQCSPLCLLTLLGSLHAIHLRFLLLVLAQFQAMSLRRFLH